MNILITCIVAAVAVLFVGLYFKAKFSASAQNLDALKNELARFVAEQFEAKSDALSNRNNTQIAAVYQQISREMGTCKEIVTGVAKDNAALGAGLKEMMASVAERSLSFNAKAEEMVSALKRGNKTQGNWGEAILSRMLDDAGLVKNIDYFEQAGSRDTGMPDVTIRCGGNKKIIVDAKVNITDFLAGVNFEKDGDYNAAAASFKKHAERVHKQIKDLAEREYPDKLRETDPNSIYSDVVIIFMPSEATFAAAVTADPGLVEFARSKKVLLSSPMMLFGYMSIIRMGLDSIVMNENQQKITKNAKMIVDRMASALDDLKNVGTALDEAQAEYRKALGHMGDGSNTKSVLTAARNIAGLAKYEEQSLAV